MSTAGVTFERVTGNVGAIVHGVDVHRENGDDVAGVLRTALHEHGVLFFHAGTPVTDDEFKAVAALFGETYVYQYGSKNKGAPREDVGRLDFDDAKKAIENRTSAWHTDGSSQETPPQAALLTPVHLPDAGGDTMWASMPAAFDALSSRMQHMLEGMEALHSTAAVVRHYAEGDPRGIFGKGESFVHPVVITDPVTRRKMLYVNSNYTERIVGMSEWESDRLLSTLCDHVNTPEFHVRLRWELDVIAVWEERVTQHRAVADYKGRRSLRRLVIRGDRPSA